MSISVFDLFKVGIGPSSSHTVGPMVAARRFANYLLAKKLVCIARVTVELFGSLGATGEGHGTPNAIILGLLGEQPDLVDVDTMRQALDRVAEEQKLSLLGTLEIPFRFREDIRLNKHDALPFHTNGMRFSALDHRGECVLQRDFFSVGGGFIVEDAGTDVVLYKDEKNQAYPFNNAKELLEHCERQQFSIAELILANEQKRYSEKEIRVKLNELWAVMQACVARGCSQVGTLPGRLAVSRRAPALYKKLLSTHMVSKEKGHEDPLVVLDWVTLYALAVNEENAAGGRIVTAPTNGAAGIIPAVLHYYWNFIENADERGVHTFLLTAAAIGMLCKKNASISGAEVGCQGEVGSACSMAAAGLAAVLGGRPEQIENAAEIAMEHHLGMTCDPVAGLVQIPCIERNAVASVKAIHAARMALHNDGEHTVSLDNVIQTMKETGRDMMEKYKETSRGGLAVNVVDVPVNIIEC